MKLKSEPQPFATVGDLRRHLAGYPDHQPLIVIAYGDVTYGGDVQGCGHDGIVEVRSGHGYEAGLVAPVDDYGGLHSVAILVDLAFAADEEL
jgi:hypothetical protein